MFDLTKNKVDIALIYTQYGFSLFPVHGVENGNCTCGNAGCNSKAKHPLTANGVKDATKDAQTLQRYFAGDYDIANIGLACGEASGVWVLDVDDLDALTHLENKHEPLPKTWICETGSGGRHYYFRFNESCKALTNRVRSAGAIDIRTTGGYVILPPSIHASGQSYRWIVSPDDCEIADAPDWLISLLLGDKPNPLTIDEASPTERAKAYLANCPPAISKSGGHNTTFAVVTQLFKAIPELHALADDDVLRLLEDWNARCVPAWSESELLHKIRDARAKTQNESVSVPLDAGRWTLWTPQQSADSGEWPILHEDALYGFAGDYVRTIEPHTEADPVALLLTLLNGFGNAVGRTPTFPVNGTTHHVNLFAAIVGDSSRARKGTSLGCVLETLTDTGRIVSGLSTGEGIIQAVRDAEIQQENGTFTVAEPTEKRLWINETEFGQILRVMKREASTLSPVLRNAWDGGTLSILTRGSPLQASNAHISIIAHVTLPELRQLLAGNDIWNGFANRFLWALCRRSKLLPNGGRLPVAGLRERLTVITQRAKLIGEMRRSPEASELWEQVYPSLVAEKSGLWDAVTSRGEAQTLRLSMLYALLDGSDVIHVQHLKAALALWKYCDDSARIIFGEENAGVEGKIVEILDDTPGLTLTEIRQQVSSTQRSEVKATISELVRRGRVKASKRDGTDVYSLTPTAGRWTLDVLDTPSVSVQNVQRPNVQNVQNVQRPNVQNVQNVQRPESTTSADPVNVQNVQRPAELAELFNWINLNAKVIVRRDDDLIWVTDESGLTPELTAAIHANQEALKYLVKSDPIESDPMESNSFYHELLNLQSSVSINVDAEAFLEEVKQAREAAASET